MLYGVYEAVHNTIAHSASQVFEQPMETEVHVLRHLDDGRVAHVVDNWEDQLHWPEVLTCRDGQRALPDELTRRTSLSVSIRNPAKICQTAIRESCFVISHMVLSVH